MPKIAFGPFTEGINKSLGQTSRRTNALDDAVNAIVDPIGNVSSAYESVGFVQFPDNELNVPSRAIYWPTKDIYVRLNGKSVSGDNDVVFESGKAFIETPLFNSEATATIYEELLVIAETADTQYPTRVYGDKAETGEFIPISENFISGGNVIDVNANIVEFSGTSFLSEPDLALGQRFYFQFSSSSPSVLTRSYKIAEIQSDTRLRFSKNVGADLTAAGFDPSNPPSQYRIAIDGFRGYSPVAYRGRIFMVDGENRSVILHTGFPGDSESPPSIFDFGFIDPLTRIELGTSFGPIQRLIVAGDTLYAVALTGSFAIRGEPPVNPALGSQLSIKPLTPGLGCNGYDAVSTTREGQGLFVASSSGFWSIYGDRAQRIDDAARNHEYFNPGRVTHVSTDQKNVYFCDPAIDWERPLRKYKRVSSQEPIVFQIDQRTGATTVLNRIFEDDGKIVPANVPGFTSAVLSATVGVSNQVFIASDRRLHRLNFDNSVDQRRDYGLSMITAQLDGGSDAPKRIWKAQVQIEKPISSKMSIIAPATGESEDSPIEEITISRTSFDAGANRFTVFGGQGKGQSRISVGVGHFADIVYGGTSSNDVRDILNITDDLTADQWIASKIEFSKDRFRGAFANRIDLLIDGSNLTQDIDNLQLSIIAEVLEDDVTTNYQVVKTISPQLVFSRSNVFGRGLFWVYGYIDDFAFPDTLDLNPSANKEEVQSYFVGVRSDNSTVSFPDFPLEFNQQAEKVFFIDTALDTTDERGPINRRLKVRVVRQLGDPYVGRNISLITADVESRAGIQI